MFDRSYRAAIGMLEIFDSPEGTLIDTWPEGFNYLTIHQQQGDWVEIKAGQWVRASQLSSDVALSNFTGVLLEEDLPYPLAWMLMNVQPSPYPGGDPVESNGVSWRYSRVYIYATEVVNGENWYQIGADKWIHQHHVSRYVPVERPNAADTERWISIDLYEQVLVAYEGNQPVFTTLVSTGLPRWPTEIGGYHVYFRKERDDMSGGQPGDDFYKIEEVPWAMFIDEGIAIHGTYWHDGFGYRHSHGCINLAITDAHWLYQWAGAEHDWTDADDLGAYVHIFSSGEYE